MLAIATRRGCFLLDMLAIESRMEVMKQTSNIDQLVASNVRAAMGARMASISEMALVIGTTRTTAGKRYRGDQPFSLSDLGNLGAWLGYAPEEFASPTFIASPAALAA